MLLDFLHLSRNKQGHGKAEGKGVSKGVEGNGSLLKTTKSLTMICLFLHSNNVDLKNNSRNWNTVLRFVGAPIATIEFQVDLHKP